MTLCVPRLWLLGNPHLPPVVASESAPDIYAVDAALVTGYRIKLPYSVQMLTLPYRQPRHIYREHFLLWTLSVTFFLSSSPDLIFQEDAQNGLFTGLLSASSRLVGYSISFIFFPGHQTIVVAQAWKGVKWISLRVTLDSSTLPVLWKLYFVF